MTSTWPEIFLSYSREDQAKARQHAEALQREGFSVWWDQALSTGESFDEVTEEALEAARAVVVLLVEDIGQVALGARGGN